MNQKNQTNKSVASPNNNKNYTKWEVRTVLKQVTNLLQVSKA